MEKITIMSNKLTEVEIPIFTNYCQNVLYGDFLQYTFTHFAPASNTPVKAIVKKMDSQLFTYSQEYLKLYLIIEDRIHDILHRSQLNIENQKDG